ncbi:hypothetical protein [Rhodoplanes elegans]|uniref:hypothetical protein n=1 Tax=Rhodoplanes elegans TaxID=29408 RepID=UPI00147428C4|nr:hypothetical protein [Rhodoplanes elegans]
MTLLDAIIAELERQSGPLFSGGPYLYDCDDPREFGIDGKVDLVALAEAVEAFMKTK